MPRALDETDKHIIQRLREDGRRSYAAIARDVGLSETSVRQRVKRLLQDKVIHIGAATYPSSLGFITAGIGIKVEQGRHEEVARALAKLPEADFAATCVGAFDVVVDVICESHEQLCELVVDGVRALPGVRDAEVYLWATIVLDVQSWGSPQTEPPLPRTLRTPAADSAGIR